MSEWKKDLHWSSRAFSDLVWPALQPVIGGRLIHVEIITEVSFAKDFDMLSGIDAWHIVDNVGIRGIASRVQVCKVGFKTFDTFTIRVERDFSKHETELYKRKLAIGSEKGWLFPFLTVQAYISEQTGGFLRSMAVAKTTEIFKYIEEGRYEKGKCENARFYVVKWCDEICEYIYHRENNGS